VQGGYREEDFFALRSVIKAMWSMYLV